MQIFKSSLLLALTVLLTSWNPSVQAILPILDSELGTVPSRPYCPAQPASPSFQRAAFYEMVNEFFNENGLATKALDDFMSPDYIQHNPFILSGRNNSITALTNGFLVGATFTFLQIVFESPFGMVHYKYQQPNVPPVAFVDIWRFNGTCIEEHWDVIQSLPANATNPLALF